MTETVEAVASVEAQIAAADISYQFHIRSPEDNEEAFRELAARRAGILARWQEARAAKSWHLVDRIVLDLIDANEVLAAAAEGLQAQRRIVARGELPPAHIYVFDAEV